MKNENLHILTDEAIVQMAQEGSSTAYEYLISEYKELVKNKSKAYYITGGDKEDVIQEGMIGIFKAVRDFDAGKDASFRTFAELCINRQIISAIKAANRMKHQILNESVSLSEDENKDEERRSLAERLPSRQDADPEAMTLMKEIVNFLKANERDIFSQLENKVWTEMLKGRNYQEIATILSLTPKNVDNAIQRIKRKIYSYLEC